MLTVMLTEKGGLSLDLWDAWQCIFKLSIHQITCIPEDKCQGSIKKKLVELLGYIIIPKGSVEIIDNKMTKKIHSLRVEYFRTNNITENH